MPRVPSPIILAAIVCGAFVLATPAAAGGAHVFVPIALDGLPPELTQGAVTCYVLTAGGAGAAVSNATFSLTGGAVHRTLDTVMLHAPEAAVPRAGSTYYCRLSLLGEVGRSSITFSTQGPGVTDTAWTGSAGRSYPERSYPVSLHRAPGSALSLTVRGPVSDALAAEPGARCKLTGYVRSG